MENAAEALKMAAAVLIFVLALSISINAFGEVRQTSQTLLNYRDREYDYTYVEENDSTERIVGVETIIPAIYRAYKENYKIVFDRNIVGAEGIYKKNNIDNTQEAIYTLDSAILNLSTEEINAIVYGNKSAQFAKISDNFLQTKQIVLNNNGIYGKIVNKSDIKEKIGVYYQDDSENTPDTNKTKKRVITYTY